MSVCLQATSGTLPPKKEDVPEIVRRSANYHPSVWGDHFLAYSSPDHAVNIIMLLVIYTNLVPYYKLETSIIYSISI